MSINSHIRRSITMVIATGCLAVAGAQKAFAETVPTDMLSAEFTVCGDRRRVDCVVDGDTFWFRRQKIRMADIYAPELSPPRCANELQRGRQQSSACKRS